MTEMKPIERELAVLNGERPDRVPIWDMGMINAAHTHGYLWKDVRSNPKLGVELKKKWVTEIGSDVYACSCAESNAPLYDLGLNYKEVDDNYSNMMSNYYKDPEDVDKKGFYDPSNPKECPLLYKHMFDSYKLMAETENDYLTHIFIWGIMTTAGHLRGVEQLLTDFMLEPELAQKIMKKTSDFVNDLIHTGLEFGCDCAFIADPSASGTLISGEMFDEFCVPYLKSDIAGWMSDYKAHTYLHICGETLPIIKGIKEIGPSVFSFDYMNDISEMKKEIGGKIVMSGNLNPMEVVWLGTPQTIDSAVKSAIEKADGERFILTSGCEVPRDTSLENLKAIRDARDRYGVF